MGKTAFERVSFNYSRRFISIKDGWEFHAQIPFYKRTKPLDVRINAGAKDLEQVKDIFDSLSLVSVQRQLWADLTTRNPNAKKVYDEVNGMVISKDFKPDLKAIVSQVIPEDSNEANFKKMIMKTIMLSFTQAQHLRGDQLAWVLSGGTDKGFAYPWIFKYLEGLNMRPDYIYGVSTGAYFGGAYSYWGSADKVISITKEFVKRNNWQQCIDADMKGLTKIGTYKGFMTGKYLIKALNDRFGLKNVYYSDMKIPFFTVSVNIDSGKAKIFCDPNFKDEMAYGPEDVAEYDYKVVNCIRASGGIPIAMVPFNINCDEVKTSGGEIVRNLPPEMHVDGGLYENIPLKAALRNKNIKDFFVIHLGYSGESEDKADNIVKAGSHLINVESISQLDIFESSRTDGTQIKVFNPRFFKLHNLAGLQFAQRIGLSASDGIKNITSKIMEGRPFDRKTFFSPLTPEQIARVKGIAKVREYPNGNYFEEKDPLIDHPDCPQMKALIEADGGELVPKPVKKSTVHWLFDQSVEQFGWVRSIALGLDIVLHKLIFKIFY